MYCKHTHKYIHIYKDTQASIFYIYKKTFIVYSTDPTFQEMENQFIAIIDHIVVQSQGIVRVDSMKVDPSRAILPHIKLDDELVIVAKDIVSQVFI